MIGWIAVGVSAFFLYLYLPIGPGALIPVEWALVLAWVALGAVLFIAAQIRYRHVELEETEYLIFGDEYARKNRSAAS